MAIAGIPYSFAFFTAAGNPYRSIERRVFRVEMRCDKRISGHVSALTIRRVARAGKWICGPHFAVPTEVDVSG
jgi:hypothetical protein